MINLIRNTINSFRASFGNAAANAFIQATGITGATQKAAITQLCIDLQASGLWSKMKAVYPMVTDNRNLLSYTEDFTNAYWVTNSISLSANTVTSPNGTLTADTITETSSTSAHGLSTDTVLFYNGVQYTSSIYVKNAPGGRGLIQLVFYQITSSAQNAYCNFDIINGVVGSSGNATGQIEDVGNGWFRCSMIATAGRTYGEKLNVFLVNNINATSFQSYAGSTSKSLYLWGAQLEASSTPSTYQPIATTPSAFMASQMKYNLKDARDLDAAFRLTWSGGWTYSATGATPNGTNAYADSFFIPSANGSNGLNYGTYTRTTSNAAGYNILMGSGGAGNFMYIGGGGESYLGGGASVIMYPNLSNGYYIRNGNSSGQTAIKNNTLIGTNSSAATYVTTSILLGAGNAVPPSPGSYSNAQIAFSHLSQSLTQQESFLLNQIVEKYQVALSRGVQAAQSFYYNSAYSNEANTYLYSTQITGATQVSAINTLINGLKANNLWTKMKAVYPFVTDKSLQADMAAQMKFNLVNPQDSDAAFRLAFSGGWTYSTNGAQPNGTNGYADTKFKNQGNWTSASNGSMGFISRTNQIGVICDMGSGTIASGANSSTIYSLFSGNTFYAGLNCNTVVPGASNTSSIGFFATSRLSSAAYSIYKRGSSIINQTNTDTIGLNPNQNIYLGAGNDTGSALNYSGKQFSFCFIADGLTQTEIDSFYTIAQQLQTDLSR